MHWNDSLYEHVLYSINVCRCFSNEVLMALRFPTDPPEIPVEPPEAVRDNIAEMIDYATLGLS